MRNDARTLTSGEIEALRLVASGVARELIGEKRVLKLVERKLVESVLGGLKVTSRGEQLLKALQ